MRKLLHTILRYSRQGIVRILSGYQHTLSPDHGPLRSLYPYGYCRHEPTCSQYAKEVIMQRGIFMGGLKTLLRVLSCFPWKPLSKEKILKLSSLS